MSTSATVIPPSGISSFVCDCMCLCVMTDWSYAGLFCFQLKHVILLLTVACIPGVFKILGKSILEFNFIYSFYFIYIYFYFSSKYFS